MSDDTLREFVSDFLYQTQGYSEDSSVDYLIAKAQKANSFNDIINELSICGITANDESKTTEFATNLFNKVPRYSKQQKIKQRNKRKKYLQKVIQQQKNESYKLVSFDIDDENDENKSNKNSKKKKKDKKKDKKHHKKDKKHKHSKSNKRITTMTDSENSDSDDNDDNDIKIHENLRNRKHKNKHKFIRKRDRDQFENDNNNSNNSDNLEPS